MSQTIAATDAQTFTNSKISKLEVVLAEGHGDSIYFTGSRLSGCVNLDVRYPVNVLKVVCKWVQISKLGNVTKRCSEKVVVFGKDQSKKAQSLACGEYRFPFSMELPDHLLPSFQCNSHFVNYYCQASIQRRFTKSNAWSTGKKEFYVYQDNASIRSLVPQQQTGEEHEQLLKPLRLSYHLLRTGYYLGETPTIVGEIYNSGKSAIRLKVGIDVMQTTKVNGEMNLLVTKLRLTSRKNHEGFGPWSRELKIEPMCTEAFSAEMSLKALPPTTHCLDVDITYQVILKASIERDISFLKPKQHQYCHDIIVARGDASRPVMKRVASGVSIGKASQRRKSQSTLPHAERVFQRDSPKAVDVQPSTSQYNTPPPSYKAVVY